MKDCNKSKESSYLKYWDVNNLHGCAMPHILPVNNSKWIEDTSQLNKDFIKHYNEESGEGYFLEVIVHYPENPHELHKNLLFFPKRTKIKKFEKLFTNLHNKTEYVSYIRILKQALIHGLILKKVHRVIKFD